MLRTYYNKRLARKLDEEYDFSYSPYLTLESLIEGAKTYTWNYYGVVQNPNFRWSWVQAMPDAPWHWESMHLHYRFRWNWVREFPDKPWNWMDIHTLDVFKPEWVREFPDKDWNWGQLPTKISMVLDFPEKPWNWTHVSRFVSLHDVVLNPNLPWDWEAVTIRSCITPIDMIKHPDLPWTVDELAFTFIDDEYLSYIRFFRDRFSLPTWVDFSKNTTWEFAKKALDLPWIHRLIRFDTIVNHDEFMMILAVGFNKWDWAKLSRWVHIDVIKQNLFYPWDENYVSRNPTLRFRDLKYFRNLKPNWTPCEPLEYVVLQWHSANVIKRAWRLASLCPEYALCRRKCAEIHDIESMIKSSIVSWSISS